MWTLEPRNKHKRRSSPNWILISSVWVMKLWVRLGSPTCTHRTRLLINRDNMRTIQNELPANYHFEVARKLPKTTFHELSTETNHTFRCCHRRSSPPSVSPDLSEISFPRFPPIPWISLPPENLLPLLSSSSSSYYPPSQSRLLSTSTMEKPSQKSAMPFSSLAAARGSSLLSREIPYRRRSDRVSTTAVRSSGNFRDSFFSICISFSLWFGFLGFFLLDEKPGRICLFGSRITELVFRVDLRRNFNAQVFEFSLKGIN